MCNFARRKTNLKLAVFLVALIADQSDSLFESAVIANERHKVELRFNFVRRIRSTKLLNWNADLKAT